MAESPNIIERAFQLAGQCGTVMEVKDALKREGYAQVDAHLSGRGTKDQIKARLNPEVNKTGLQLAAVLPMARLINDNADADLFGNACVETDGTSMNSSLMPSRAKSPSSSPMASGAVVSRVDRATRTTSACFSCRGSGVQAAPPSSSTAMTRL